MQEYLDLMQRILDEGEEKEIGQDGYIIRFGHQMRFDLSKGFPMVTTKKLHLKSIVHEATLVPCGEIQISPISKKME